MYDTYRLKHSALTLDRSANDQFFFTTLIFSVFLYFFSFYFIYQTVEILKHIRSGSTSQTISASSRTEPLSPVTSGQTIFPKAQTVPLGPQTIPQSTVQSKPSTVMNPSNALPFDLSKAIDKAIHQVKPGESITIDIAPFSHIVNDKNYEANFGESKIVFRQKADSSVKTDLELELVRIQSGGQILYSSEREKVKPEVKENHVSYRKAQNIQEIYESSSKGLEQSWVFQKPLSLEEGKDLVLLERVSTLLVPRYGLGGVIDFHDTKGNYITTYGKGTLKDASGKMAEVFPQIVPGSTEGTYDLSLTLPAGWMADASYPVTLDPLIGNKLIVAALATGDPPRASIAFDGTNYMVVWMAGAPTNTSGGAGASDLYGAVVSPNGTIVVPAARLTAIAASAANDQMYPSVAYNLGLNKFLIVYQNYISTTATNDIYGILVSYTTAFTINAGPTAIQASNNNEQFPDVATDGTAGTNNFYVVYARGGTSVRGNPVSVTNTAITGGGQLTLGTVTSNATAPSVLPKIRFATGKNIYLAVWEDFSTADTNGNIYGNTITTPTTTPTVGTSFGIAVTSTLAERYPSLAFDGTNFLVAYQRGATGGSADVYGEFVTSPAYNTISASFAISAVAASDQTNPAIAFNTTTGIYLVDWQDARTSATLPDIYGARVSTTVPPTASNVLDGTTGVLISNQGTLAKSLPAIASGGPNFYTVWRDGTTTSGNINGQLIGPPQINSVTPFSSNTVEARNPVTINSTLYGTYGTFGPDPGSAVRSTTTNNVVIGGFQIGNADVTSWSLTSGVNSSIGIVAPYATAVSGGTGVGTATVTSAGWASTPSSNLTIQDYSLGVSPPSASVNQGSSTTYTVTLTTINAFASSVTLSVPTGCPPNATCTFSPNPISGNGATSTLTVATAASTTANPYTLTIQGTGGTNNQLTHTTPASLTVTSANKLVITSLAQTVSAGASSTAVTIQAQTSGGALISTATDLVNLSSSSGTMLFSASSAFTTTIKSISLASGQATIYFQDTKAASPIITISNVNYTSGSQTETITAAAASQLVMTSTAQTVTAGSASGAVTVQAQDSYNNLTSSTATVNLSANSGTMTFSTTSAFTTTTASISLTAGSGSFYFKDPATGTPTITAASTGLTSATQTETIAVGAASQLMITTTAQTVTAGVASGGVTVQAQDSAGNLTSSTATVNLTSTSGTMTFSTTSAFTTT
ncbi:MAG: hypothetical protein HYR79_04580, partial [Nitrospirae bacterium]|nr:hypothetical protein [Nitrospirota bacterium]